jgi:hypothetical protein
MLKIEQHAEVLTYGPNWSPIRDSPRAFTERVRLNASRTSSCQQAFRARAFGSKESDHHPMRRRADPFLPQFRGTEMRGGIVRRGTVLSSRDDYRQNAIECLRLARGSSNASDRTVLINMAHTWRRLAEHAAAMSCFAELVALEGGIKP